MKFEIKSTCGPGCSSSFFLSSAGGGEESVNFFKVGLIRLFGFTFNRGLCVVVREENDEGLVGEIVKPKGGNSSGSDKSIENEVVAVAEAAVLFFAVFDISCFPVKLFLFFTSGTDASHRQQCNISMSSYGGYNMH